MCLPRLVRIYLLGPLRVENAEGKSLLPRGRKASAILACLALAAGDAIPRASLATLLWDNVGEAQAKQSLRQALSELRSALGPDAAAIVETTSADRLRLAIHACWIDIVEATQSTEVELPLARSKCLLEGMDDLAPAFGQWLIAERSRFENTLIARQEDELARLQGQEASPATMASAARRLLLLDPAHEGATRALMRMHAAAGERAQAIREYERCRKAIRTLLDTVPSIETIALFEAIKLTSRAVAVGASEIVAAAAPAAARSPDPKPVADRRASIAVLPLRNLGAHDTGPFLGEGIVEDVVELLSRVPTLFVISRLSTLGFRDRHDSLATLAEALGVRYMLDGSYRVAGHRIRVSIQLTDTQRGTLLWSSRLDGELDDVFMMQERIAEGIVRRIAPYLHEVELSRIRAKPAHDLAAYELVLRAIDGMHRCERQPFFAARAALDEAIIRDPDYAAAHAWSAKWHLLKVGQGWSDDHRAEADAADVAASTALALDGTDPLALSVNGHIAAYLRKDFDTSLARFDHALRVNPNSSAAWQLSAATHAYIDEGAEAVTRARKAIALTPFDPLLFTYTATLALAHVSAGEHEQAVDVARQSLAQNRRYTATHRLLAIALAELGRVDEAREVAAELMAIEPEMSLRRFRRRFPALNRSTMDRYVAALERSGIPA